MSKAHVYSVVRFTDSKEPTASPSAEALGYFLSVRFADAEIILLRQSLQTTSFTDASGFLTTAPVLNNFFEPRFQTGTRRVSITGGLHKTALTLVLIISFGSKAIPETTPNQHE